MHPHVRASWPLIGPCSVCGTGEEGATKSADLEEDVKEKEREKARLGKKVIDLERSAVKLQQQLEG